MNRSLKKGDQILFTNDDLPYEIKAINERYAVCTRSLDKVVDEELIEHNGIDPEKASEEIVYTIVDFQKEWRGPNNYVFNPYDYNDQKDIDQSLIDLQNGEYEISRRNGISCRAWSITTDATELS